MDSGALTDKKFMQAEIQSLQLKNLELKQRIQEYENHAKEQNFQIARQDTANKDAKLNRALEELEKLRLQLRSEKAQESGKNNKMRFDMEKLVDTNRSLEKQRNELLQAFKKQMKLIDVLKRQKLHIESAKLLNFTEDEFVNIL